MVNVEIAKIEVTANCRSGGIHQHSDAVGDISVGGYAGIRSLRGSAIVDNFQIVHLPTRHILQQHCRGVAVAVDERLEASAVLIQNDGIAGRAAAFEHQLVGPMAAGLEIERVPGGEHVGIHIGERLPGRTRRSAGIRVAAAGVVHIVARRSRWCCCGQ